MEEDSDGINANFAVNDAFIVYTWSDNTHQTFQIRDRATGTIRQHQVATDHLFLTLTFLQDSVLLAKAQIVRGKEPVYVLDIAARSPPETLRVLMLPMALAVPDGIIEVMITPDQVQLYKRKFKMFGNTPEEGMRTLLETSDQLN